MDILVSTLCDFAADYQGKLCIQGGFDSLVARQFPVVHPVCAVALRICLTPEDEGTHELGLSIVDADGTPLDKERMPIKINFPVPAFPEGASFFTRNLIMNFQGLRFEKPGNYSIDLTVDGELAPACLSAWFRFRKKPHRLKQPPLSIKPPTVHPAGGFYWSGRPPGSAEQVGPGSMHLKTSAPGPGLKREAGFLRPPSPFSLRFRTGLTMIRAAPTRHVHRTPPIRQDYHYGRIIRLRGSVCRNAGPPYGGTGAHRPE